MDEDRRTRVLTAGNALIQPRPRVARDRHELNKPARHVVRVNIDKDVTSVGYRYNDDVEVGVHINTNFLLGLFK